MSSCCIFFSYQWQGMPLINVHPQSCRTYSRLNCIESLALYK